MGRRAEQANGARVIDGMASLTHAPVPGRRPARSGGWLGLVFALLLALSWQTGTAQGHFHSPAGTDAQAAGGSPHGGTQLAPTPTPAKAPATCPLCRELAHAGQLLSSDPTAVAAPFPGDALAASLPSPDAGAVPQRSHAWHSRGPPRIA